MEILAIPDTTVHSEKDSKNIPTKILDKEENGREFGTAICKLLDIQELSGDKVTVDFNEIDIISDEAAWGMMSVLLDNYTVFELNSKSQWINKKNIVAKTLRSTSKRYCSLIYDNYWR